jgi:hypothetical protein
MLVMSEDKPLFFKYALSDALIFSLVMVIYSLLKRTIVLQEDIALSAKALLLLVFVAMTLGMLIFFIKRYRDRHLDGVIDLRRGFNYGMVVVVASVVTMMMYDYIFLTYIDPDFVEKSMEISQRQITEMFLEQDASGEQAEKFLSLFSKDVPTATETTKGAGASNLLWGLIASLISGAVCVRKVTN